jgi:hypothetical protein
VLKGANPAPAFNFVKKTSFISGFLSLDNLFYTFTPQTQPSKALSPGHTRLCPQNSNLASGPPVACCLLLTLVVLFLLGSHLGMHVVALLLLQQHVQAPTRVAPVSAAYLTRVGHEFGLLFSISRVGIRSTTSSVHQCPLSAWQTVLAAKASMCAC